MMRRRPVPWLVGATCLAMLTVYNVLLGFRLVPVARPSINDTRSLLEWLDGHWGSPLGNDSMPPLMFRPATARLDNRRRYKIHDYVVVGRRWDLVSNLRVCLATQTSLDRLSSLGEVATMWQGPVSVAVFTPDLEFPLVVRYIDFLLRCFPAVRDNASFHFIYPISRPPMVSTNLDIDLVNLTCEEPIESLQRLVRLRPLAMVQWRERTLYPQNHLRNVARKTCQSMHVFQSDVDIVPRRGLALSLAEFLRRPDVCDMCAFVVPTYEVDIGQTLPNNKSELLNLVKQNKAQPFHKVIFIHNQFATNNTHWEHIVENGPMDAAYKVTNYEFFYEPFYVSRDTVPPHDERFIGYGYTRNTQVYETVLAGYKLWVLNNAFALHRGLVLKRTRPMWRERQNTANAQLLEGFKRELAAKYSRDSTYRKKTHPR